MCPHNHGFILQWSILGGVVGVAAVGTMGIQNNTQTLFLCHKGYMRKKEEEWKNGNPPSPKEERDQIPFSDVKVFFEKK